MFLSYGLKQRAVHWAIKNIKEYYMSMSEGDDRVKGDEKGLMIMEHNIKLISNNIQ